MNRWIFLRGLTREAGHWGDFTEAFRAALPGARVELLDLPGCGIRHREPGPGSIGGIVEALRAACRAQRGEGLCLLGLSLGGMCAIDWACRYPGEVAALVAVNSSARPYGRFIERLKPRNYASLARLAFASDGHARETAILRMISARPETNAAWVDSWCRIRHERPVSTANALRQLLAASRYRAPEAAPQAPLLVLSSHGDRLVDPRCSQRLATSWGAALRVHPTAGHDLPLDEPAWVAATVRAWLDERGAAVRPT